jgi:hypothetical protein
LRGRVYVGVPKLDKVGRYLFAGDNDVLGTVAANLAKGDMGKRVRYGAKRANECRAQILCKYEIEHAAKDNHWLSSSQVENKTGWPEGQPVALERAAAQFCPSPRDPAYYAKVTQ